jgi:hypothetical protein
MSTAIQLLVSVAVRSLKVRLGEFRKPEKGELPSLETAVKQRLVKTVRN